LRPGLIAEPGGGASCACEPRQQVIGTTRRAWSFEDGFPKIEETVKEIKKHKLAVINFIYLHVQEIQNR